MNINQTKQKFTRSLKIVSTFLIVSLVSTNGYAIKLTINNQPSVSSGVVLNLTEDVVYSYSDSFRPIVTNTDLPYLCIGPNLDGVPTANVSFGMSISDPFKVYGLVGIASAVYDYNPVVLSDKTFSIQTNNNSQCVVKGFVKIDNPNPGNPLIFVDSFESSPTLSLGFPDLEITLLESNTNNVLPVNLVLSNGQDFVYRYELTNVGDQPLTFDIVDYFSISNNSTVWTCDESVGAAAATTCGANDVNPVLNPGTADTYNGAVYLKNVHIENNGESIVITVTKNPNIVVDGTEVEILASALVTNWVDTYQLDNSDTRSFIGNTNTAPVISTVSDQIILEDAVAGTGSLIVIVSDVETAANSLVVTASSSDQGLVSNANITIGGSGGNRTVAVISNTDANTDSGSVTITLSVNDGSATTTSNFTLDITPVNDKPTFTVATINDFPAGTSGNQFITSFVTSITFGPTMDENTQSIADRIVSNVIDPNGILDSTPLLGTDLLLDLSGQGGTASFDIQLQDNGDVLSGGMDTSDPVTVTFTVLNTLPTISVVPNTSTNEDNDSAALAFTISDAETAPGSLTMTAMSSDTSIVPISGIVFSGIGGSRTVQITPATNLNTSAGTPVTITLIVNDGSGAMQTTFDLTVNPINDAPTFSLGANITNATTQAGPSIQVLNFATALSMGPTTDEDSSQNILGYIIQVTDASTIFDQSVVTVNINNNGTLSYVLTGNTGTATIDVRLQDNGATANGGVDTSPIQSFTITVQ